MAARKGILVIDDGDIGGLVGCAAAGEEGATGGRACVFADVAHPGGVERGQAVRRHAEIYGLDTLGGLEALTTPIDGDTGPAATRLLMDAAFAAAKAGLGRVLWCVHFGGAGEQPADLERIASACDRALLVSRLLSLDASTDVRVEVPYADFTDVQMAELAADLDAPLESCWWATGAASGAAMEARARWTRAMETAGLGDLLMRAGG